MPTQHDRFSHNHRGASLLLVIVAATACSTGSKVASPAKTTVPQARAGTTASSPPGGVSPSTMPVTCRFAGAAGGSTGSGDVAIPGDIPDTQPFFSHTSPADGYHIDIPDGWAESHPASRTTAFSDKFSSVVVKVMPAPAAPTVDTVRTTDIPALAASVPCFKVGHVSQVSRKAGPAVLVTYQDDSAADPVTGKVVRQDVERYALWQNGMEVIITLSSPVGSDNVDPWRRVTDSFGWTP